ncbi:type 4a pilus biogenesis protein PilO [candidate division WOR-3 bacterium]|nr:type 4a pilus biogenesis protein PilO [candidate division WOR-3 bacterium]
MNNRLLAALIFLLGVVGAISLFFYMQMNPLKSANNKLKQQLEVKRAYEDSLRQVVDVSEKIEYYKALLKSMEGLLAKAEAMVPKEADRNDICALLIELSHQANVTILSSTPSVPVSSNDGTGSFMIPVALNIEGTYQTLGKFLEFLANNQRILKLSSLSITPSTVKEGFINVSLVVNAYYLPVGAAQTQSPDQWN